MKGITARQMISELVLNYQEGLCLVMPRAQTKALPVPSDLPPGNSLAVM